MVRHNTAAIADVPVIYTVVAGASDYTQFIASGRGVIENEPSTDGESTNEYPSLYEHSP